MAARGQGWMRRLLPNDELVGGPAMLYTKRLLSQPLTLEPSLLSFRAALALLMAVGTGDTVQKLDLVVKRLHALGAPKASDSTPVIRKVLVGTICCDHLPSAQCQRNHLCCSCIPQKSNDRFSSWLTRSGLQLCGTRVAYQSMLRASEEEGEQAAMA